MRAFSRALHSPSAAGFDTASVSFASFALASSWHFFACRATEPIAELPARFRWVRPEELPTYRFPPANVGVIEELVRGAS